MRQSNPRARAFRSALAAAAWLALPLTTPALTRASQARLQADPPAVEGPEVRVVDLVQLEDGEVRKFGVANHALEATRRGTKVELAAADDGGNGRTRALSCDLSWQVCRLLLSPEPAPVRIVIRESTDKQRQVHGWWSCPEHDVSVEVVPGDETAQLWCPIHGLQLELKDGTVPAE